MSNSIAPPTIVKERPGHFGPFGGQYVPETLMPALSRLIAAYDQARLDPEFQRELAALQRDYVGRPTPLYHARKLSAQNGGAQLYLKREDLAHTGAHKINNALGQGLLARRMGKQRIIAETGAGQHGVATATVCAMLDQECIVYMGEEDIHRQSLNVFRMKLLGAEVRPVSGRLTHPQGRHQRGHPGLGDQRGRHPLHHRLRGGAPPLPHHGARLPERHRPGGAGPVPRAAGTAPGRGGGVRGGREQRYRDLPPLRGRPRGAAPGSGSGGHGVDSGRHAATLVAGSPGVLHGAHSYLLQDEWGQVAEAHSISAGLDYPGVGPEHAFLKESGRASYVGITDETAMGAFQLLCRTEGIIPALESAHAVACGAGAGAGPQSAAGGAGQSVRAGG